MYKKHPSPNTFIQIYRSGRCLLMKSRSIEIFMWVTAIFVASNIYLFIPIYSDVAKALSISFKDVVFSSTLFTFSYSVGLLSFGPISERYSKKKVLFVGIIISCILTYLISFSFSLSSFYILTLLKDIFLVASHRLPMPIVLMYWRINEGH